MFTDFPVSAGPFVVTLYGDIVAPRGGEVWMGSIVEACGTVGIAESRVRTAVSRLVAAGRIAGVKLGRRSYYRLTPEAEREFAQAARLIYAPVAPAPMRGWHLVVVPEEEDGEAGARLGRLRFGFALPRLAVLPDRGEALPALPGCRFAAVSRDDPSRAFARAWELGVLDERMRRFVSAFAPLEGRHADPGQAVGLRLMLVHAFREIALRDPLLPQELLPAGWPGEPARALFVRLYAALSPACDAGVAAGFLGRAGPLRPDPAQLARRLERMGVPR